VLAQGLPPHLIVVQGDTTSAFVAAYVAFQHHIAVAHIEAGLRTYRAYSPFPEEINRQLLSSIAALHFAPSELAASRLRREGAQNVVVTGNTVIDIALRSQACRNAERERIHGLRDFFAGQGLLGILDAAAGGTAMLILLTCHRREHLVDSTLSKIFSAVKRLLQNAQNKVHVVYPVHPAVASMAQELLQGDDFNGQLGRLHRVAPMDYDQMGYLLEHARFILTDSGGLQEEATAYHVPVLVLRESTEREEAVHADAAVLVGLDEDTIVKWATWMLNDHQGIHTRMSQPKYPFGYGNASKSIVDTLLDQKNDIMSGLLVVGKQEPSCIP